MIAFLAFAVLWSSALPTTGSPCVEWRWRFTDPSGEWRYEVLTAVNHVEYAPPLAPIKTECDCHDAQNRWSPLSPADVYYPPALLAWWGRSFAAIGKSPLTAAVMFARSVEWRLP
ncbi:MAG: hypothetical protein ABFE13_11510 [Phycisphaerales bacterium]